MAYKNLDLVSVKTFGKKTPVSNSWADSLTIVKNDFSKVNAKLLAESLKDDVEEHYMRLTEFYIKDFDTDFDYVVFFDNALKLWNIEFATSKHDKNIDILPNEKFDILRSDVMKKAVARSYQLLLRAMKLLDDVVMEHIEMAELLEVDETKLEAISFMLHEQILMDNYKKRMYEKQ